MSAGNVLLVTVDQWRGDCLGVAGHPVVQTPNLDRLARRGTRFANHWSVTAPCGPSRASLLTGLYLMHHRSVGNGTPLDARFTNVAQLARSVGYQPVLFGYTDTSVDPRTVDDPDDPRLRDYEGVLPGFDVHTKLTTADPGPWVRWLAAQGLEVPSDPARLHDPAPGQGDEGRWRAPTWFPAECTETAFLTEQLLGWLDEREHDDPWFAHVSYIRPHPPYRAPAGYHDRYDPDDGPGFVRGPSRDDEVQVHPLHAASVHVTGCPVDERELRKVRAAYWANMTEVDDQLGRVLDHLEASGELDRTLVVVTSDHGDQMGDHWLLEKLGWWDESYWIPLLVADPRPTSSAGRGRVVDEFTESVDLLPTLCDWMGVEVPVEVDGRSLAPFTAGEPVPERWRTAAHWQWDFRDPVAHLAEDLFGLTMEECALDVVRGHDHKYVHLANGDCLLFDLRDDPEQLHDLASDPDAADLLARSRAELLTWRMRHDDRTLTGHRLTAEHGLVVRRDPRR